MTRRPARSRSARSRRPRRIGAGLALALGAVLVAARFVITAPFAANDGYQLSLLADTGRIGLTVLLLVVMLWRPAVPRSADRLLLLGASLTALAVAYQLGIQILADVINAGIPGHALPSGPRLDPRLEAGAATVGAALLALGVDRLDGRGTRRALLPAHVAILGVGVFTAALVTASAALPGWFPDDRTAVLITGVGALAWAALAVAAIRHLERPKEHWLVAGGASLMLLRVGLNAGGLLVTHRMSGPVGSYDTYVVVAVLGFAAWAALCAGFFVLESPIEPPDPASRTVPSEGVANGVA